MPWDNSFIEILTLPTGATSGARIVIDGTRDVILLYDSTNALIASAAASAGTDGIGNSYVQGFAVYGDSLGNAITSVLDQGVIQVATNNGNYVFALDSTGLTMHDITLQSFLMPGALDFSLVSGGLGGGSVSWTDDGTAAYLLFDSGTAVVSTIDGVMWLFSSGSGIPSQGNNAMLKVGITFGSPCDIELWGNLRIGAVDQGKGLVGSANATANTTFAATETALLTTGSINFENGRAYEVSVWGLASAAADSYALLKLRKGTVAGTIYKDQMRVNNLQASSSNAAVSLQFILTNTTGSDISTAVVLTGIQGAVAQTWTWAASAGNVTHITVKDIGLASQWPGQPIS